MSQLQSVTWTFGRNRVTPTPVPRIIACVHRGVVMKVSNSVTAGRRAPCPARHTHRDARTEHNRTTAEKARSCAGVTKLAYV